MSMTDISTRSPETTGEALRVLSQALAASNAAHGDMKSALAIMADTMNSMCLRIEQLERTIAQLTPITPAQARALGTMVRDRSAQLQAQYGLPAQSIRSISAALRKAIQLDAGVRTLTELPRTLYPVYADFIAMWDDYDVMTSIKKRFETKGGREYGQSKP